MKCPTCRTEMESHREAYRYDECGLSNVTLLDVEVRQCPACGARAPVIRRIEDVHRALAAALVMKPNRLAAAEIRFLRKSLGWSGVDFAAHMGVTAEQVSRWESGAKPMGATADRALRLMVLVTRPVEDYDLDALANLSDSTTPMPLVSLRATAKGWERAAA
jgi:putative zinc finger/helix-turn-helix YgiT family protein